ncbi:MAG: terminase small subunit [Acidobacteria bacterium]|nr:terminase small subunit [Acidobacteriota bacterium]
MKTARLTGRQELFAQHYALTGNGTLAAIRSGCPRRSAHTRAYKWVRKGEIQDRIQELREEAFSELRHDVSETLYRSVMLVLRSGLHYAQARRAVACMNRLGVYEYTSRVKKEIEEIEERFGVPFEEILDAMWEAQFAAEMAYAK